MDREKELISDHIASISLNANRILDQALETDTSEYIEEAYDKISDIEVGASGYVYVIDSVGNYVVSKGRSRDGENIWNAKDSSGRLFIQDIVNEGRKLRSGEIYFIEYLWLNTGEDVARMKVAAISYNRELDVVIGAGSYYTDFLSTDLKEELLENIKNAIAAEVIGETGYIWVINSEGEYIVSKSRSSDGVVIYGAQDSSGSYFVQEIINNTRILTGDNHYIHYYPWRNKDENCRISVCS